MKKVLVAAFALISISASAQKGSWYIGGNVGFSSEKDKFTPASGPAVDGNKTTAWTFSPEIGTFVTKNIQVGLGITLGGSTIDNQQTGFAYSKTTASAYGATLYSRYFFGTNAFKPFVGVNVSALPGTSKTEAGNPASVVSKSSEFNFGANLNAGFAYSLSNRVSVVGSFGTLGFQSSTSKNKLTNAKSTSNAFGLDAGTLGNRFTVGVYYTIKK